MKTFYLKFVLMRSKQTKVVSDFTGFMMKEIFSQGRFNFKLKLMGRIAFFKSMNSCFQFTIKQYG